MGRLGVLMVVAICLLLAVAPVGAAQLASGADAAQVSADENESFDRSQVSITVYENGSAHWTFQYERTLENESQVQQFEQFAERFRTEETPLYTNFQNDSRELVSQGRNVSDRPMRAGEFSRNAEVTTNLDTKVGVVSLSFVWHGFARTNSSEGHVVVGDVFKGGLYLSKNQSLVVQPGPNLAFESVTPNGTQSNESSLAKSESVTWEGEYQFTDQRPKIVFQNASNVTTTETSGLDGLGGTGDDGDSGNGPVPMEFVVAGVIALLVLGGAMLLHRSGDDVESDGDSAVIRNGSSPSGGEPGAPTAEVGSDVAQAPAFDAVSAGSDSARVIALLRTNSGQMRQSHIVDETGWSKSKVSMLLSEMEADGHIRKQRIGRENIITLTNGDSAEES